MEFILFGLFYKNKQYYKWQTNHKHEKGTYTDS